MAKHANEIYLQALRDKDPKILRDLYHDFFPSIHAYVLKNNGTTEDAKDIFGDVLEALLRKINKGGFVLTCKMNTFLTEMAARQWKNKLRRRKFDAGVTTDDPVVLKLVAAMETPLEKTEAYSLYRKKFKELGKDCQQVLQLGIREGKSHQEVIKVTGHTMAYSRKMRSKCLKKLTTLIKADHRYKELAGQ